MIKDKETFLIALSEFPPLAENTMAFVFAANPDIDISSREKFFDNIISYYKQYKAHPNTTIYKITEGGKEEEEINNWVNKDLRIKYIRLKSVRGIPDSKIPYGFNLTNEKDEPQSLIILGGNGTGKSSIYDAVEYCFCNSIGEAQLRAYKEGSENEIRFKEFLEHFDNGVNNIFCEVTTVADKFSIQKDENIPKIIRDKINPDTHFVSDFDIYSKGQLDYEKNTQRSFHNTIAQSLGLSELLEFEKNLKAFSVYRRQVESRNISALRKSNDTQQKIIDNNTSAINERKVQLEKLKESQVSNPDENNIKEILEKINQLKQTNIHFAADSTLLLNQIKEFDKSYSEYLSKEIKNAGLNELQFLNLGLDLLKEHSDCPFCNSSKLLKDELAISVKQRIEKIQELNESTQRLNKTFNAVFDTIENLKNQIEITRSKIVKEISFVQEKVEFNELLQAENSLTTSISELLSKDLYAELFQLNDNPNFLKDKNRYLFDLFKRNKDFIPDNIPSLISNISSFIGKRTEIIRKIELTIANKIQGKTITEQIIGITKEITDLENQIAEAKRNLERDNKKISELQEQQLLFDKVKEETSAYLKVVHATLNKEVEKSFGPIKLVVEEILENYFKADKQDVELVISKQPEEVDEETGEVLSEIIAAHIVHKQQKISPQPVGKYLNTFHYRLFSTMVGISIAIASRINTKVNLPLVLDDIFYASDFENRATIESFLKEIFKAFKTYTPDLPLQLILFTHDQLIFESAIKIMKELDNNNIGFAKLFSYKEAKEAGDYLNLIYKFPEYYPHKIMNSLLSKV